MVDILADLADGGSYLAPQRVDGSCSLMTGESRDVGGFMLRCVVALSQVGLLLVILVGERVCARAYGG